MTYQLLCYEDLNLMYSWWSVVQQRLSKDVCQVEVIQIIAEDLKKRKRHKIKLKFN